MDVNLVAWSYARILGKDDSGIWCCLSHAILTLTVLHQLHIKIIWGSFEKHRKQGFPLQT